MQRHPERRGIGLSEFKVTRKHADDGDGLAIEANRSAYDVGMAAEIGAPECIAQNDEVRTVGLVFAIDEVAAERGLDAERGEEICGDTCSDRKFWFAAGVENEAVEAVASEGLESLGGSSPIAEVG